VDGNGKRPHPATDLGCGVRIYVKTSGRLLVSFSGAVALFSKGTSAAE
jgi:hypothetical protein